MALAVAFSRNCGSEIVSASDAVPTMIVESWFNPGAEVVIVKGFTFGVTFRSNLGPNGASNRLAGVGVTVVADLGAKRVSVSPVTGIVTCCVSRGAKAARVRLDVLGITRRPTVTVGAKIANDKAPTGMLTACRSCGAMGDSVSPVVLGIAMRPTTTEGASAVSVKAQTLGVVTIDSLGANVLIVSAFAVGVVTVRSCGANVVSVNERTDGVTVSLACGAKAVSDNALAPGVTTRLRCGAKRAVTSATVPGVVVVVTTCCGDEASGFSEPLLRFGKLISSR